MDLLGLKEVYMGKVKNLLLAGILLTMMMAASGCCHMEKFKKADAVAKSYPRMDWSDGPLHSGKMVFFKAVNSENLVACPDKKQAFCWSFGDESGGEGNEITHAYPSSGNYYAVLTSNLLLGGKCLPKRSISMDTVIIRVIENPYITDTSTEKDLTYRLPNGGDLSEGTTGWMVNVSGGGSVIPHPDWVSFCVQSTGGIASMSFKNNFTVDMSDDDIIVDEVQLCILYRLMPGDTSSLGKSDFEVRLYGDNSTNNLPLSFNMTMTNPSPQPELAGFKGMDLCASIIPQDFHRITNMTLEYRGESGNNPELQIEQIYLWVLRVKQ